MQNFAIYEGIKLASHTIKIWKRVIKQTLRKETRVTDNQFWFYDWKVNSKRDLLTTSSDEAITDGYKTIYLLFY
jgi:hypothetical protein